MFRPGLAGVQIFGLYIVYGCGGLDDKTPHRVLCCLARCRFERETLARHPHSRRKCCWLTGIGYYRGSFLGLEKYHARAAASMSFERDVEGCECLECVGVKLCHLHSSAPEPRSRRVFFVSSPVAAAAALRCEMMTMKAKNVLFAPTESTRT